MKIAGQTRESNVKKQCIAGMVSDSVRMQRTCLLPVWRCLPQPEQEMHPCTTQALAHPGLPGNATAPSKQSLPGTTLTLDPFHAPAKTYAIRWALLWSSILKCRHTKFKLSTEKWKYLFYAESNKLSWHAAEELHCHSSSVLTFITDLCLHSFPISRIVCSEHVPRNVIFFIRSELRAGPAFWQICQVFWWWSLLPCNFCASCYELLLVLSE